MYICLNKEERFYHFFSGVLLFGGIALAISTSKESSKEGTKENSKEKAIYGTDDNHASFSYMLF